MVSTEVCKSTRPEADTTLAGGVRKHRVYGGKLAKIESVALILYGKFCGHASIVSSSSFEKSTEKTVEKSADSSATSLTLVGRIQASDQDAWQRLVELYGPLVYSWSVRSGLNDDDASDTMQEVFAAVARSIHRFDPQAKGRFRGWLWTIARNKIHDHFRARANQPRGQGGDTAADVLANLPQQWNDEESETTRYEVRALYHRAMELIQNDFRPQTWQAFWLSVVQELPTEEIAKRLGLSANSVRQARSRVLKRLRNELGEIS